MDFTLTEEQRAIRDLARTFARDELIPLYWSTETLRSIPPPDFPGHVRVPGPTV